MKSKKVKKILKISAITIVVLLAIVISIPFLFKDRIIRIAKEQINSQLNAVVGFGDADLWFLRTFPNITLKLDSITIDGIDSFQDVRLAEIDRTILTLNIMNVFRGETIDIRKLALEKPMFYLLVNKEGLANWDIFKVDDSIDETEDEESMQLANLQSYDIQNGKLIYDDQDMDMKLDLIQVRHSGKGDFSSDFFELTTISEVDTMHLFYKGMYYLKNAVLDAKVDLDVDLDAFSFTFKENEATLNELPLAFDGFLAMPEDDIEMDISFQSTRSDFKTILSFIPAIYTRDFNAVQTTGNVAATGRVNGTYSDQKNLLPAFNVDLKVDNASFKYPELPGSADNIRFHLSLNSGGKQEYDDMVIKLTEGYMRFAGQPVEASLLLTHPFSDPNLDTKINGRVDLADIGNVIPLEQGERYGGIMDADIELRGRLSAIEQKRYNDFVAKGIFLIQDLVYESTELPYVISAPIMDFRISPQHIALAECNLMLGENDIKASGTLDNYLNYMFEDQLLKGSFVVSSNHLNLNDLMTDVSSEEESGSVKVIELPGNIDFRLKANVAELMYEDIRIQNASGEILLKDKIASLQNFKMDMMGGKVNLNGAYNVQIADQPHVEFDFALNGLDINEAAVKFVTVKQLVPIASYITGLFSASLKYSSELKENLRPNLLSIFSSGTITTNNILIEGFEPLMALASKLNISKLANQKIQNLKLIFKIEDGRMTVDPYKVNMGNIQSTIAGYTSLNQDIYYVIKMDIPRSEFGSKANTVLDDLFAQARSRGLNVDKLQSIIADVIIEGKITAPKISFKLADEGKDAIMDLRDQVESEVKQKIDEVRKEAEDKVTEVKEDVEEKIEEKKEEVRAELEKRANQVMEEAEKQAAKLRSEAKNAADKIRQESKTRADQLEEEASNVFEKQAAKIAADKIKEEGNRNADRIEQEAETRSQKILDEANKRADRIRRGEEG